MFLEKKMIGWIENGTSVNLYQKGKLNNCYYWNLIHIPEYEHIVKSVFLCVVRFNQHFNQGS